MAHDEAETGYDTPPFTEELDLLCWRTVAILKDLGVATPTAFPEELDFDYEAGADDDDEPDLIDTPACGPFIRSYRPS